MDVRITLGDVAKQLRLQPSADGYVVTVDGREHRITAVNIRDGKLTFMMGDVTCVAHVSNGAGGVDLTIGGHDFHMPREHLDADRPAGGGHASGDGTVEAPMPGTIVAINAKPGDTVNAGYPLIVLESMKMQNEITSPVAGSVKAIHCKQGDQVGFGDVLAEVTPGK